MCVCFVLLFFFCVFCFVSIFLIIFFFFFFKWIVTWCTRSDTKRIKCILYTTILDQVYLMFDLFFLFYFLLVEDPNRILTNDQNGIYMFVSPVFFLFLISSLIGWSFDRSFILSFFFLKKSLNILVFVASFFFCQHTFFFFY